MNNKLKPILIEAIWLIISVFSSIVLRKLLLGWTEWQEHFDIPLHDTYFVFSTNSILLPLFFFVTFIIYFFKEKKKLFSRVIPNWIMTISGLALLLLLTLIGKIISEFDDIVRGGWTAFPPLSASENQKLPVEKINTISILISYSLVTTQLIIVIMLMYVWYWRGVTKGNNRR